MPGSETMNETEKAQANQQEPSMEDILASIRRILSEDGEGEQTAPQNESALGTATSGTDISEAGAPPALAPAAEDGERVEEAPMTAGDERRHSDEARHRDERAVPPAPEKAAVPEIEFADVLDLTPEMRAGPVLSSPTSAASSDALAQLAKAILDRRDVAIGSRDITLEGMVREMLRPMLKEWLDRNLPYLIERLVKKEIDLMVNRAERLED